MKFVFWGPEFKPAYAMFREIFNKRDDVIYVHFLIPSYIIVKIYDALKPLRLLIKRYVLSKKMYDDEMVFIYYNPWGDFLQRSGCLKLLRERYKKAMHIVLLYDVNTAHKLDIDHLKRHYDKIYIYDQKEADRFGISCIQPCYSKNFEIPTEQKEQYDLSFVGQAKGRLREIISVYEKLTAAGLKCHFYIVNAGSDCPRKKGIVYGNRFLDEKEYFKSYIVPARCLLEIGNDGTEALTARVREAVMYDKKILSNNKSLKDYKYYRKDMMQVYDSVSDIDLSFFKERKHSYCYAGDFSPIHMLSVLMEDYNEFAKQYES